MLCEALCQTTAPLKELNFCHNEIGNLGGKALSDVLFVHYNLKILKISWNKIRGDGAIAIAEALRDSTMVVLDASYNNFGQRKGGEFANKLLIAINKGHFRHIDLSYNNIEIEDCKIFA